MSLTRGILLAGRFVPQHQLNAMSNDTLRNTLIFELGSHSTETVGHLQSLDDATLAGMGAVFVFLRDAGVRTEAQLKTITSDDMRNILIVELGAQTSISGPVLQGMSNMELVLLGLGKNNSSFIRGVLLALGVRSQHALDSMSADDQRNTLIVEMNRRTNQSIGHFQSLNDNQLAGAGAVLVFLQRGGIRTDAQLKTASDDDMRNIMIVELAAQTNISTPVLQGTSNMDLVLEGLGGTLVKPVPVLTTRIPLPFLTRGVLLAGKFATQTQLNAMSNDTMRNTMIFELRTHSTEVEGHLQSLDDATLTGMGAVFVFLRDGGIRTEAQLKTITSDDMRNILIVELGAQTGLSGPVLQGMTNLDLVLLGLGKNNSFIRGVLLAGGFRSQHDLNNMSKGDQRNTLIVEMHGRTNQPIAHFQTLNDLDLAGAGAVLLFLRNGGIRTDAQLKALSDDDMRNNLIVELGVQTKLSGPALQAMSNLDLVLEGLGGIPVEDAIATRSIDRFHRGTGNVFGPLGPIKGAVRRGPGLSYVQDFQVGSAHLSDFSAQVAGEKRFAAEVTLAAVRVFGTQNHSEDSSYIVMSLMTVDPNQAVPVQTQRTNIQDGVHAGDTLFKNALTMRQDIAGTSGIAIHLAVWDHEHGDQDGIRDKINAVLQDGIKKAGSALAGGDLSGAGLVGDITNFEIGGVKPFQVLTLGAAGLIANLFADDMVGEHTYVIPAANIVDLADQTKFNQSIRPPIALDSDVQFNWPPRLEDEFLFSDGKGSYKVYLRVRGIEITEPVLPALPVH